MKNMKLTKAVGALLTVASVLALNPIGANAEWKQDSNGWWNSEGSSWSIGWKEIDGKWYYFDNNGYMKTGWVQDGDKWYYLDKSGFMKTGWIVDGDKTYYLNKSGDMAKNTTIDGYTVDSNGVRHNSSNSEEKLEHDNELQAEGYIKSYGYEITKRLDLVSKVTLNKSMLEDGKAENEIYKKILAVQSSSNDYYGGEITIYGFTVKNHPLENKYNVDTNVYFMFSGKECIGKYSIPNNGSTDEIYSIDGKTEEEVLEDKAEGYIKNYGYKITKPLGLVSKITLDKSMLEDGNSENEIYKKILAVQNPYKEYYYGKEITTYGFTVKNHPLENKYNVDTNVYFMFSGKECIGEYSIPNNGSTDEIYSINGKTAEEVLEARKRGSTMTAKPVIYLYPKEKTDINVNLDYQGEITCLYPKYNKDNTWEVTAYPDGRIIDKLDNREYSYLYWEGITDKKYDLSKGFVVKGEDTAEFLYEKLKYLGLTTRESDDFITFWLPKMNKNKYNLVSFQNEEYTKLAKLNISPAPDSLLRIFMVFKPLDSPIEVQKQELETFNRKGFTVVEWGGSEINENGNNR
jgi:hypothetical protein